jgi:FlaA1/EpsC-like NDP-sugar epimerase
VLGSRGSVVPTFARQIDLGGPVTVTHPDTTRYFMDISEAAGLIIQAAGFTRGDDIFMLEMGERIRVDDLARKMIRLRGLRPDIDIAIVYTGMRPGEKLHEELVFAEEDRELTAHPLVYRVRSSASGNSNADIEAGVLHLLHAAESAPAALLVQELMELAGASNGSSRRTAVQTASASSLR